MLRTYIEGCKWGVDPIEGGIQINLLDEQGNQVFHIPFTGEALAQLTSFGWDAISDEDRRKIQAQSSGIILASEGDMPRSNGNGH